MILHTGLVSTSALCFRSQPGMVSGRSAFVGTTVDIFLKISDSLVVIVGGKLLVVADKLLEIFVIRGERLERVYWCQKGLIDGSPLDPPRCLRY